MNGTKGSTNGVSPAASGVVRTDSRLQRVAAARERFAAGADTVRGVRPEILMSWYRCREEYEVDPGLDRAPAAAEVSAHTIEHDVVFAELGGLAASADREVEGLDGLVTVADPDGRILAVWGSRRIQHLAAESNLAPWSTWSTWSEWACGTNGMGTALESHRPVVVYGPERWCQAFQAWSCAGVAVRDVVTDDPLAVLNISCWQTPLPESVLPWLRRVPAATGAKLRQRAHHSGTLLAAAFANARVPPATPLAVVDPAGNVVLANSEAAVLIGTPADVPAFAPTQRWASQVPSLPQLARRVTERARQDPDWDNVWLTSDQGRLLAAARGLDHLEHQLTDKGFLRVHRRFLVNLNRVREVEQGFKGELYFATDVQAREVVPVSRRHAPQLRQVMGL